MQRWPGSALAAAAAPVVGTCVAADLRFGTINGFWQGLVIQLFLLLAPIDVVVARRGVGFLGLRRRGSGRSLLIGGGLAAAYLLGLGVLAAYGVTMPHFDGARRVLGLGVVLLLYVPLWGVLEAVWVNHLVSTCSVLLGVPAGSWASTALAAGWFGVVHVVVQVVIGGAGAAALVSMYIGVFAALAGLLLRATGSGWGFVLFWTVCNF